MRIEEVKYNLYYLDDEVVKKIQSLPEYGCLTITKDVSPVICHESVVYEFQFKSGIIVLQDYDYNKVSMSLRFDIVYVNQFKTQVTKVHNAYKSILEILKNQNYDVLEM